jgi:hypothetical protein
MTQDLRSARVQIVDELGQLGLDILGGVPVTITEKRFADPKVLAIMLMSRTLSNFRGVFLLIDAGLLVEARVLVRCCFENAFWIAGLHTEGDAFARKMLQDEMRSRKARGELVLSRNFELSEEVEKRLRLQLRAMKKIALEPKSLDPKQVALNGVLRDGYLIYTQLSADSTHPTVSSLHRHVGRAENEEESLIDVVPTPKEHELLQTWDWACNAMLGACTGVNEILGGTPAGLSLEAIADRYQALASRGR